MANETYFEATDGTTRLKCCGQPPGSSMCTCDVPVRSQAERQRNAAMKLRTTISRARETPKAAPVATFQAAVEEVSRQTGYGPRMASTILQLARASVINPISERTSHLPDDYDVNVPPDPFAASIAALRAERGMTA